MKTTFWIAVYILCSAVAVGAVDLHDVANRYGPVLKEGSLSGAEAEVLSRFEQFGVALDDTLVVDTARYVLTFRVSPTVLLADSLGGFVFSFPDSFDLSRAEVGALADDHPEMAFSIQSTVIADNVITVGVGVSEVPDATVNFDSSITFALAVADIINPRVAGFYQVAGLTFDILGGMLAGPRLSSPFAIYPRDMQTLMVQPGGDTTVVAGTVLEFAAVGFDVYGNEIADPAAIWSLTGGDAIGLVAGNALTVTTVGSGRMQATAGGLSATSGLITVIPGPLAQIQLDIPSQQLVGMPLVGVATATLWDAYGNLRTGHNLAMEPLALAVATGELNPSSINSNDYFDSGVVDLVAAGVLYEGPTAQTQLVAGAAGIVSNVEEVSFSGYDILAVLNADGGPLTELPADAVTLVRFVVRNNGSLTPGSPVFVGAVFQGYPLAGGSATFAGGANGAVDTVPVAIRTDDLLPGATNMGLRAWAEYEIGGQVFETGGYDTLAVTITEPVTIELVSTAIGPDTLYPRASFPVAFEVRVTGLAGEMDSSRISIFLDGVSAEVFSGLATGVMGDGGLVSYTGITAIAPDGPVAAAQYALTYQVYAGAQMYGGVFQANSAVVLDPVNVMYMAGSLRPPVVAGGYQTAFSFDLNLNGSYSVELQGAASTFSVQGLNFVASANLRQPEGLLAPGPNPVQAEALFIPESQIGTQLVPGGQLVVYVPSADAFDTVEVDFGGETVPVRDLGVTQIVSLEVIAPNAPNVNVSQPFQLRCLLANLSDIQIGAVVLRLSSDGTSAFDSVVTIEQIVADDTVEVFFSCVAAEAPNTGEIFRVEAELAALDQVVFQPPEDNVALVRIQEPAQLRLMYSLLGVASGVVDHNTSFGLTIELENLGEAAADSGAYRLTTDGVRFGLSDTLEGGIAVGRHIELPFMSPGYDTTVTFRFALTRIPHDLNTGEPALIESEMFEFVLRVESQDADLFVAVTPLGSNLVNPGEEKDLFELELTNEGTSSVSSIRLESFRIDARDRSGRPANASHLLVAARTVMLENGEEVAMQVSLADRITIRFDSLTVASGQTRKLVLRGGFVNAMPEPFTLGLETDDFEAVFQGGTHDGFPVRVKGADGPYLFSRTYVMRGRGLEESFVIENNPFDPMEGPARFAYELTEPSRVEFRVFTLTGEEVYAEDIPENGGQGEGQIEWDGRNDDGGMVSNGVYLVSLRVVRTGEQAMMKVAVVK